jgi:hypothetical protein
LQQLEVNAMLKITRKGTYQDSTGFDWDYYGDDTNPSSFYIIPRPQFVLDGNGNPSFEITRYATDDSSNGAGHWRFDIELSVPAIVQDAIRAQIPKKFPNARAPYFFLALNYNPGGTASLNFASGGENISFSAPVSSFGSNVASFLLQLTKEQLDTVNAAFTTSGGAFEVEYQLSVPARLPAVTARLSFDSTIAYQYQVTHPAHNRWGHQTRPGSVQELLHESAATKVDINWGIANPPSDLRQAVSKWANATLADLVTAEVRRVIQLQGIQSGDSFNINEVNSFSSVYTENMVINWIISPRAALTSFPTRGLKVQNFTSTVNEQQQHMTVSVFLPFKSDSANSNNVPVPTLPGGTTAEALVDHVTVTVSYPGLSQSNATRVFTQNDSHTFVTAYDETAGPNWSLEYTVTYSNTSIAPVTGRVSHITAGAYTLQVEEAGILTVVFDAQQAFANEGTRPIEVDISFSYINGDGSGELIERDIKIRSSDNPQQQSITSYQAMPLNSKYNYRTTYVYPGGVRYVAPLVQGRNGFLQVIPSANAVHSCNVIVFVPSSLASVDPVFDATVQMWYQQSLSLPPGVSTLPTKESPAVFTINPASDSSGNLFGRATFVGLLTGDQPLVYSASIDAVNGQIDIAQTLLANTLPSLLVSPTQRYFTLEISPGAIDWDTAAFQSVEVVVKATVAQGTAPGPPSDQPLQRLYTWNRGESGSKYDTYAIQNGNEVTYDWKANYITPGQPVETAKDSGASDLILNIPAAPTATSAAGV